MPLSRFIVSSVGLAVILSIGGQPVFSGDEPWGGPAWEWYQGSRYEADRGGPGSGPYEGDLRRPASSGAGPGFHLDPSGDPGNRSAGGDRRGDYWDYRNDAPYAGGQDGFTGGPRRDPRGDYLRAYPGPGPEKFRSPELGWQGEGAAGYPPDDREDIIRSQGQSDWSGFAPAQMRPLPGLGSVEPTWETYPGYRFRGDPPAYPGHWQSARQDSGYRFRPLTDQERWRQGQGPEFRPSFTQDSGEPPFPGDPSLQPEAAFGFEPSPWRAR